MSVKKMNTNWQRLELLGKFLILFSICFQLIIIENTTSKSAELDRIDRRNSYNLESSNHSYLVFLVEEQGLETQLVTLQNQRLLVQMYRLANVDLGGDKQALIDMDKSLSALTDNIISVQGSIEKQRSVVEEALQQAIDISKSSKILREDLKNIQIKSNSYLNSLNCVFLIIFTLGSLMTLYARYLELREYNHPTGFKEVELTSATDESG